MQLRNIRCDLCENNFTEQIAGTGYPGWGRLLGVIYKGNKTGQLDLCPQHFNDIVKKLKKISEEHLYNIFYFMRNWKNDMG